jgi:Cu(I)/Ag(I) efflux system membrane fusion protein
VKFVKSDKLGRALSIGAVAIVVAVVALIPASRRAALDFVGLTEETTQADVYYTCPMHPDIRLPQMGDCPICGMSLVEKREKRVGEDEDTGVVSVTARQVQLTGISVESVGVRNLSREIAAFGKIDYDETRLAVVSAWVAGRIDELHVNFTGVTVGKGHPLVWLYSPDLISTQNEFLLAVDNLTKVRAGGYPRAIKNAEELVESSRRRLTRWGLSAEQLDELARTRDIEDHVMINAPQGGTVIQKVAYEGMYVKEGDVLFRVADLSTVWLDAQVYEDDIPLLLEHRAGDYYECPMHPDQVSDTPTTCSVCGMDLVRTNDEVKVNISVRAFPGEEFEGKIAFTDPFLDPETRTVGVRVNITNPDVKLKPNMYARARIHLPTVRTLAVPENAVIQTGSRNIVLVEESPGRFRPQPVRLGRMWLDDSEGMADEARTLVFKKEALRYHEVLAGLETGENVVVSGNFLLGSESQLQGALAKMMDDEAGANGEDGADEHHYQFIVEKRFGEIVTAYYAIWETLAGDKMTGIPERAAEIVAAAGNESIRKSAEPLRHAHHKNNIEETRKDFHALSDVLILYVASQKAGIEDLPLLAYCPMKDASWLQDGGELLNPYYGSKMLHCGKFQTWK